MWLHHNFYIVQKPYWRWEAFQFWYTSIFRLPITKFFSRRKRRAIDADEELDKIQDEGLPKLGIYNSTSINPVPHSEERPNFVTASFEDTFDDEFFTNDDKLANHDTSQGSSDAGFSQLFSVPSEFYCSLVKELDESCLEVNPLELWSYNRTLVEKLTQDEIIRFVNHELIRYELQ